MSSSSIGVLGELALKVLISGELGLGEMGIRHTNTIL